MTPWAADSAIKVALLLVAAIVAARQLHRASAAVRHWILVTTLVAAVLLPIVTPWLPAWRLEVAPAGLIAPSPEPAAVADVPLSRPPASSDGVPAVADADVTTDVGALMMTIWLIGSVLMFAGLLIELARLRWHAARSVMLEDERLAGLAVQAAIDTGLRRPVRIMESPSPALLATWGLLRPRLMLPISAREWSDERARIVFLHEMAHIRRFDWCAQLLSEALRCLYWFNPLTWIAASRLRQESEQACDDAVLVDGVDAADYAAHLLELARVSRAAGPLWLAAPAMARP